MKKKLSRENHYVADWYQRGFLAPGQHELIVLNLSPAETVLPNGKILREEVVRHRGPAVAFTERDLYTTRFGTNLNDEIERLLFGPIDTKGAAAVRAWISDDLPKIHYGFRDFFEYLDAQKLRTPKGLDWIQKYFSGLPQLELMRQMQALRQMHATMWSECVREIVTSTTSTVKFLVTDHPVTVFNPKLDPGSSACAYPDDPGIQLIGTQTVFALDANHCLILTNLEYAMNPKSEALLSRRTNARFRGNSMARTDAFIRGRALTDVEVHAINFVLKSRAKRFVAASNSDWLYPERYCSLKWEEIAQILLPKRDLFRFGGETYIGHKDGSSSYRDQYGRTSKAHEYLAKRAPSKALAPGDPCGCGSGLQFEECCVEHPLHQRPSWHEQSIRERNLSLIRGIEGIFELTDEKTWLDIRRDLSDDQIRRIHRLFAALWPADTQLVDLLPRPQKRRSRGLYLGIVDARALSRVIGMLAYVDELVLVHPFVNANGIRPEFSPVEHPERYSQQTLESVFTLLALEPFIRSGRIHLVPDPLDFDAGFRNEIKQIVDQSDEKLEMGPIDKALHREKAREMEMRAIKRLAPADLKAYIRDRVPENDADYSDEAIELVVRQWKADHEEEPFVPLSSDRASMADGELLVFKGFARETGLFIATLTGSFVYTDSDTVWRRLHESDGVHLYEGAPSFLEPVGRLSGREIEMQMPTYDDTQPSGTASAIKGRLRILAIASQAEEPFAGAADASFEEIGTMSPAGGERFRLHASVPNGGFQRTDVSRLVVTFGRFDDLAPVRLGVFIEPIT